MADLFAACASGDAESIAALLAAGAAVNQTNSSDGLTPLLVTCFKGHAEIVSMLLAAGARVAQAMRGGATPLLITCQQGHTDIVPMLLAAGAAVDQAKDNGTTPLSIAWRTEIRSMLLAAGSSVGLSLRPFALVDSVAPAGPAATAGLQVGDRLLRFGGLHAENHDQLKALGRLTQRSAGSKVVVILLRAGSDLPAVKICLRPCTWDGPGLLGCHLSALSSFRPTVVQQSGPCRGAGCKFFGTHAQQGFCSSCSTGMTPDLLAEAERLTFAEETWAADGVTFSDREMTQLRSMMSTLAGGMAAAKSASSSDDDDDDSSDDDKDEKPACWLQPLPLDVVTAALLEARRLLTPHQGKDLYRLLTQRRQVEHDWLTTPEPAPWSAAGWRSSSPIGGHGRWAAADAGLLILLAGFLSDPDRWCSIACKKREQFWAPPKMRPKCWANLESPSGQAYGAHCHSVRPAADVRLISRFGRRRSLQAQPAYDVALRASVHEQSATRLAAAACLTRALPRSVLLRNGLIYATAPPTSSPTACLPPPAKQIRAEMADHVLVCGLPRDLVERILDFVEPPTVDPTRCSWLVVHDDDNVDDDDSEDSDHDEGSD